MVISDLSHLKSVETSVTGRGYYGYYPYYSVYKKIDIDQDAYAKAYASSFKGDADAKAIASNVVYF